MTVTTREDLARAAKSRPTRTSTSPDPAAEQGSPQPGPVQPTPMGPIATLVEGILHRASQGDSNRPPSVRHRLESKFGLGDRPDKRRQLYARIEALIDTYGLPVYDLVNAAVVDSVGRTRPDRYFARTVCARLRETGYVGEVKGGEATW